MSEIGGIDVILPVLNERGALPGVLASLPPGYHPIVVDNASTDGSGELAAELGATVVREPVRGFGAACFAGLMAATAEIVCFMDADGSLDGADLPKMVGPLLAKEADLVLGRRRADPGAWPLHARLANRELSRRVKRRCGVKLQDFGWPLEMVVRAADNGWVLQETAVTYRARVGKSKVTGTVRGTLRTVKDMSAVLR
jgi:glycosyltransferase involved in cell wall biosynthesis